MHACLVCYIATGAGAGGTGLHWTLQEEWEHPDPSLTVRMFALSAAPHAFIQATVDDASSTDWTAVTFEVFVYIPGQHDMRHHWRTTHCIKVFIDKQQPRTQMPSICVGVQQQSLGFNDPNFWLVSRLMDKIMFDWVLSLHTTTRGAMSIYLSSRYFQSLGESDMVVWDPLNPASAGALWMRPGIRAYCHYPMAHTLPRHLPDPLVPPDATLFL